MLCFVKVFNFGSKSCKYMKTTQTLIQYGRLWYNNAAPMADEVLINTANWPAGMYFIRVDNGKTQQRIPLLVVH